VCVCAYRYVCMCVLCVVCTDTPWLLHLLGFWPAMTPFPALRCACVCVCAYRYVCMCVCEYRYTLILTPCYDPLTGIMVYVCVCVHTDIYIAYICLTFTPAMIPFPASWCACVCVCAYRYIYWIYLSHFYTRYDSFPASRHVCVCLCVYLYILNKFGIYVCVWERERAKERVRTCIVLNTYVCIDTYTHTHAHFHACNVYMQKTKGGWDRLLFGQDCSAVCARSLRDTCTCTHKHTHTHTCNVYIQNQKGGWDSLLLGQFCSVVRARSLHDTHTHTHTCIHAHTNARAHTHTHTHTHV